MSTKDQFANQIFVELLMTPTKDTSTKAQAQVQVEAILRISRIMVDLPSKEKALEDLKLIIKDPEDVLARSMSRKYENMFNEIQKVIKIFKEVRKEEKK